MLVHAVGAAIEPCRLAARLVQPQDARRMIPGERALETGDVVFAQREARILLGSAARDVDQRVMRRELGIDHCRLFGGQEDAADRCDRRLLAGGARRDLLAIDESPFSAACVAEAVLVGIVDPPRHRLARIGERDDDPERLLAFRKIGRAVERIDNPALAFEVIEHGRIGGCGFLAKAWRGDVTDRLALDGIDATIPEHIPKEHYERITYAYAETAKIDDYVKGKKDAAGKSGNESAVETLAKKILEAIDKEPLYYTDIAERFAEYDFNTVARALGYLHQTEKLWQDPKGKMCVRGSKFAAVLPTKK